MWFKNLLVYRFTAPFALPDDFDGLLTASAFFPCGSQDISKAGWVPPMPDGDLPSHTANGATLICLRKQQKVLPAGALAEALEDKIRQIETDEARKVYRKERRELKDEILISLAPRALTRSTRTFAYIDAVRQLIVVNTASRNRAEELLTQLRNDVGSLPIVPVETESDPATLLTRWAHDCATPEGFTLGDRCDLRDVAESTNTVKVSGQEVWSDEVSQHIDAGKQITRLAMAWRDGLDFTVDEDLIVRRLKFRDAILDRVEKPDDARAQFDQEFGVMLVELRSFIAELFDSFGGVSR